MRSSNTYSTRSYRAQQLIDSYSDLRSIAPKVYGDKYLCPIGRLKCALSWLNGTRPGWVFELSTHCMWRRLWKRKPSFSGPSIQGKKNWRWPQV